MRFDDMRLAVFAIFFIGICLWLFAQFGMITISVTGQPQIDSLNGQLTVCQKSLETCNMAGKAVCECRWNGNETLLISGYIMGVLSVAYAYFGWGWLVKRLMKKPVKDVSASSA